MVDLARVLFPDLRYEYMPSVSLTLLVNLYFYFILNKPCPNNRVLIMSNLMNFLRLTRR